MKVELTLVAKDLAGQTGRSETIEIALPERRFTKPLARAVVEQRRRLVEDPRDRLHGGQGHRRADAGAGGIHRGPAGLPGPAVGLLAPAARGHARRPQQRRSRSSGTSRCASRTATSPTPSARCAPPRSGCRRRCEDGASDEEIQRLMQELRQALAQFLEQLPSRPKASSRCSRHRPQPADALAARPRPDAAQPREHGALGQPRHGPADAEPAARPARPPAVGPHGRPGPEPALRPDDGRVRRHHRQQQQLLDDTFGQQRQQGSRAARQRGQKGQQGSGPAGSARPDKARARARAGDRPAAASATASASCATCSAGCSAACASSACKAPGQLGGAEEAMERAERALRDGDLGRAPTRRRRARSSSCGRARARWPSRCCARCPRATAQRQSQASSIRWAGRRSAPMAPIPASASRCPTRSTSSARARSWRSCAGASARPTRPADRARVSGAPAQALLSRLILRYADLGRA